MHRGRGAFRTGACGGSTDWTGRGCAGSAAVGRCGSCGSRKADRWWGDRGGAAGTAGRNCADRRYSVCCGISKICGGEPAGRIFARAGGVRSAESGAGAVERDAGHGGDGGDIAMLWFAALGAGDGAVAAVWLACGLVGGCGSGVARSWYCGLGRGIPQSSADWRAQGAGSGDEAVSGMVAPGAGWGSHAGRNNAGGVGQRKCGI